MTRRTASRATLIGFGIFALTGLTIRPAAGQKGGPQETCWSQPQLALGLPMNGPFTGPSQVTEGNALVFSATGFDQDDVLCLRQNGTVIWTVQVWPQMHVPAIVGQDVYGSAPTINLTSTSGGTKTFEVFGVAKPVPLDTVGACSIQIVDTGLIGTDSPTPTYTKSVLIKKAS